MSNFTNTATIEGRLHSATPQQFGQNTMTTIILQTGDYKGVPQYAGASCWQPLPEIAAGSVVRIEARVKSKWNEGSGRWFSNVNATDVLVAQNGAWHSLLKAQAAPAPAAPPPPPPCTSTGRPAACGTGTCLQPAPWRTGTGHPACARTDGRRTDAGRSDPFLEQKYPPVSSMQGGIQGWLPC